MLCTRMGFHFYVYGSPLAAVKRRGLHPNISVEYRGLVGLIHGSRISPRISFGLHAQVSELVTCLSEEYTVSLQSVGPG